MILFHRRESIYKIRMIHSLLRESSHLVNQMIRCLLKINPVNLKLVHFKVIPFFKWRKISFVSQEDSFFSNGEESYLNSQDDALFRSTPQVAGSDPFF